MRHLQSTTCDPIYTVFSIWGHERTAVGRPGEGVLSERVCREFALHLPGAPGCDVSISVQCLLKKQRGIWDPSH